MPTKMIKFNKIENGSIFQSDFKKMSDHNLLKFSDRGLAIVYGPNGTGKTSMVNVLGGEKGTKFDLDYDGINYVKGDRLFYIIHDQNNRNIISGSSKDFLLGGDIRKEIELKDYINSEYSNIKNQVISQLKNNYRISTKGNKLINLLDNVQLKTIVLDFANSKSKGDAITLKDFLNCISTLKMQKVIEIDESKYEFFLDDYINDESFINLVQKLTFDKITQNVAARTIEENDEALRILQKYKHKSECIVCDSIEIDSLSLIERKTSSRDRLLASLIDEIRTLLEKAKGLDESSDPFAIREHLLRALEMGTFQPIKELQDEINQYKNAICAHMNNMFINSLKGKDIGDKNDEYNNLLVLKPEIEEEDLLFIKLIIRDGMGKDFEVKRDDDKNLKIFLSNTEFLGKERSELPLSAGEQNFLSLTFEFLRAKGAQQPIIVLDDPISSFDSIYKNKVAYSLLKILDKKQRVVLTHNVDLLRILESQCSGSYNLYILNNAPGELNGFIELKRDEMGMLINLEKLLDEFRSNITGNIIDAKNYLISMIPFMRGYAKIIGLKDVSDSLTDLMHGYKTATVDVAKKYRELFKIDASKNLTSYVTSVPDILNLNIGSLDILDKEKYPLLDKTLRHSVTYLYLRLRVEKVLVDKYKIDPTVHKQLGDIISCAFPESSKLEDNRNRVTLLSKKTLVNEFNHFEGNLSIFQPAIDITDTALEKEKKDILNLISAL